MALLPGDFGMSMAWHGHEKLFSLAGEVTMRWPWAMALVSYGLAEPLPGHSIDMPPEINHLAKMWQLTGLMAYETPCFSYDIVGFEL